MMSSSKAVHIAAFFIIVAKVANKRESFRCSPAAKLGVFFQSVKEKGEKVAAGILFRFLAISGNLCYEPRHQSHAEHF
jgi:hypothetical protein